jgi:hypothetical protein
VIRITSHASNTITIDGENICLRTILVYLTFEFCPEDLGDIFLQNVCNHLQDYMASTQKTTFHPVCFSFVINCWLKCNSQTKGLNRFNHPYPLLNFLEGYNHLYNVNTITGKCPMLNSSCHHHTVGIYIPCSCMITVNCLFIFIHQYKFSSSAFTLFP